MNATNNSRGSSNAWTAWIFAVGLWLGGVLSVPAEEKAEGARVPEGVELLSAIQFGEGDGQPLLLDLAQPKAGAGPYPALVFVHGGGWGAGDRSAYRGLMMEWAKFGLVCVTVEYRLTPKYHFPSQLEDVKCAVRWLRANAAKYHVDAKRVGAIGGSAGAHLVGMLGTTSGSGKWEGTGGNADQSSAIQMMICHGTPSDLLMAYEHTGQQQPQEGSAARGMLTAFLGGMPDQVKAAYLDASPVQHVSKTTPPTLLLHGVVDPLVLLEQAEVFAAALEKAGVPVELVRMEGAGHSDFGKEPEKVFARVGEFLKKYLLQQ
jgi:acetyl esterase/lipase